MARTKSEITVGKLRTCTSSLIISLVDGALIKVSTVYSVTMIEGHPPTRIPFNMILRLLLFRTT